MRRAHPTRMRGAALPLALILLAVLTAIAVAAVSLSGQERVNAASYSRIDFVNECATAAQAKLWAELANQGTGYLGEQVAITSVRLPDGSTITAPAHYDSVAGTTRVKDVVVAVESSAGKGAAIMEERDMTNTRGRRGLGQGTHRVVARCKDTHDRALEIELSLKFNL